MHWSELEIGREFYSHLSLPFVLLEEQHETGTELSQSKFILQ